MLQDGIDATDFVTGSHGVVGCDDGFKQGAPVKGAVLILWVDLGKVGIAAGLDHPEFKLALVRIESDCGCCVGPADAVLSAGEPFLAAHIVGFDQLEGGRLA
jgi:hypothetical protein